jgi:hypothetical protein
MKEIQTTKSQTKPPVDREAVRVLAIELGAREAARRLKLNPNTVLSWARRYDWKLPDRRDIGRPAINPSALSLQSGDVLLDEHKRLEGQTKTALMQTTANAATHAAEKPPLDVSNTSQLRDLAQSAARIWEFPNRSSYKKGKIMSTENVNYAFQVAATNGNGFSVFFRDPRLVIFRINR